MKLSKYWLIFGAMILLWEIFWFARYNITINVAQAIAKAASLFGLCLFLIYLLVTIIFIIIKKQKKKGK
jgi:hypothetical protein